jgi:hypothetical protein
MAINTKPAKCEIVNLATYERKVVQFNPPTLTRSLKANWARLTVPGLSHQPLHFVNTGNTNLPAVEFQMDRGADPSFDVMDFFAFMRSLLLPPEPAGGVPQTSPPRVLFVWPKVLSLEFIAMDVSERYDLFYPQGGVRAGVATVTFEQILDFRLTGEDVRNESPLTSDQVEDALVFVYGWEG